MIVLAPLPRQARVCGGNTMSHAVATLWSASHHVTAHLFTGSLSSSDIWRASRSMPELYEARQADVVDSRPEALVYSSFNHVVCPRDFTYVRSACRW